ncbi:MAG: hypothetical protein LBL46_02515 [Rickettsiales bacterium]|nr:hypothetical protein [Rickettsiales bacterium]
MKIPVLKALANPARIFFVPFNLAVFNFVMQLFVFVAIFAAVFVISGEGVNPLYFLLSVMATHSILAVWSKKEPFLLQIWMSRLALWRKKIPNILNA